MDNHCVFIKCDLKYDGRVCAIIKTLAYVFPADNVYVFALVDKDACVSLPLNVKYIKHRSIFFFSRKHIFQAFKAIEFAVFSFFELLYLKPKTVQVHHEVVILGPLLYKLLKRKCFYIYDDKEMYIPKNKNISVYLFFIEKIIIKRADLVIYTNEYRQRAIHFLFKPTSKYIIVENFVFEPHYNPLDESTLLLLRAVGEKKILLHQGIVTKNRGLDNIITLLDYLPDNWIIGFIGISSEEFMNFVAMIPSKYQSIVKYFGFISYSQLNTFWKEVDASLIFYNADTFNNKYAAPNRLYSAADNGVPIIVNKENVTLRTFITKHISGVYFPPKKNVTDFFENFNFYRSNAKLNTGKFNYSEGYIPQLMNVYENLTT